jgi:hypothetical protein
MTTQEQKTQENRNGNGVVDVVVEKVQSTITQTAQSAKDQVGQQLRQKADEVSVEVQDQTRTTIQRLREWFNASNRRMLVVERKDRSIVKLPLTAGLLILAAGLLTSAPIVLILFGVGVALRLSLRVDANPNKPKRK